MRSVVQKWPLEVSFRSVNRSVARKCGSEVLLNEKCRSSEVSTEVLLGSVDPKCRSEVSIRSVLQKCQQKCCSEVWIRSVAQ